MNKKIKEFEGKADKLSLAGVIYGLKVLLKRLEEIAEKEIVEL